MNRLEAAKGIMEHRLSIALEAQWRALAVVERVIEQSNKGSICHCCLRTYPDWTHTLHVPGCPLAWWEEQTDGK
jgi:hypothetical protein